MKKIMFFDIDGTLTSEIDGKIPDSVIFAIREARKNGNLMYINTGRCFRILENRFQEIGFDGYVCGCGTNIYVNKRELFYKTQTPEITNLILNKARECNIDLLFESKENIIFDLSRPLIHPGAKRMYETFLKRHYNPLNNDLLGNGYHCDKFVIWFQDEMQLNEFRKLSDQYFDCIDRGGQFREFVPIGYSKATGMDFIIKYHNIDPMNVYAIGDSNNDLPMLKAATNSIAMGNSEPASLFNEVSYITSKASDDGIYKALKHFGFF